LKTKKALSWLVSLNISSVDFANEYIGGGVIHQGMVQEEILFMIFPELLFSCMIFPKMENTEAIAITGVKRFSNYTGYSWSTKYDGEFNDTQPLDKHGRIGKWKKLLLIDRTFVAIDALMLCDLNDQIYQFFQNGTLRDLNKAYIGFKGDRMEEESKNGKKSVTTGRWGCGAFNGNAELKFVTQWIATSAHNREMTFSTFKEKDCNQLSKIIEKYEDKSISELYKDMCKLRVHIQKQVSLMFKV